MIFLTDSGAHFKTSPLNSRKHSKESLATVNAVNRIQYYNSTFQNLRRY